MISIIIPLYNRVDLISYTLKSLSPEHHEGITLEVIVVDDCSSDKSAEIVAREFSWVRLIRNVERKGASACRNQGIELANGELIFFLDSDDLIESNYFTAKVDFLNQHPSQIGAYGPWDYFESQNEYSNESIRPRHSRYPLYTESQNESIIYNTLHGWFIPINAVVWRTKVVKEVGGFTAELSINQDVDLIFKMLMKGEVSGIESPRALIRIHQGERVGHNISEKKLAQILELRKIFINTLRDRDMLTNQHKEAVALYTFNLWVSYRNVFPHVANDLVIFSSEIYPHLKLRGSLFLRLLAACLGNKNAIRLKQMLRNW